MAPIVPVLILLPWIVFEILHGRSVRAGRQRVASDETAAASSFSISLRGRPSVETTVERHAAERLPCSRARPASGPRKQGEITMAYHLEGRLLEVCDFRVLCPCWIGEDPDNGTCDSAMAYHFD